MGKFFKYLIIPILVLGSIYFIYKSISGKSTFKSLYIVPENAAIIIESEDVFRAWDDIIHSDAWFDLKNIESLAKLNTEINSLDSTINNNKLLFRLLGDRKITISYHPTQYKKYDFLLIADVGKATRIKNLSGILKNSLGKNIKINSRMFQDQEIIEILDRASGEMMFLTFLYDKVAFSYSYLLVEQAIKEQAEMHLARNLKFLEVYEKTDGKGLFTIYLNQKPFIKMLKDAFGMHTEKLEEQLQNIFFGGLFFNISADGLINLEGYASYNDTISNNIFSLLNTGKSDFLSKDVIPEQIASATKINFSDAVEYFHESLKQSGQADGDAHNSSISKLEKRLNIDIEKNLLSWIDREIVLVQTKPSNLGKLNEFAVVLHAKNEKDPKQNLDFVYEQIKKNSPIKVKKANYKGYDIAYISFPGLLKAIFGRLLERIEVPYIAQIEDNVIISNHPQVLKNIIDDFEEQKTLANNINYYNFIKHFKTQCGMATYIDVPVVFSNLKYYFDNETWAKLKKDEEYITSFSNAGLYLDNNNNLFHFDFKAQYDRNTQQYSPFKYTAFDFFSDTENGSTPLVIEPEEDNTVIEPSKILIRNLDASEHNQYFADSTLQLTIELKDGLKHGTFKEYYKNGNLKIRGKFRHDLPDGKWKYYTEDGEFAYEKEFDNGTEIDK